jgi:hypothetical protein
MGDQMSHSSHGSPGLVLVADSARLYDRPAPGGKVRLAVDLVILGGSIVAAFGLSIATRVTRRS